MKICAVVLDYRGAERTEQCLRSLNNQGINAVLIVDNSADEAASIALDLAVRNLMQGDLDYVAKMIRPNDNLGFSHGVNRALNDEHARDCDAFLLINNDATAGHITQHEIRHRNACDY